MAPPSTDTENMLLVLKHNLQVIIFESAFPLILETALFGAC